MSERAPVGFLNINKALHLTSHDVVARIRRVYRASYGGKKVGHAGTLDPLAEGVLVICLGAATRLSEYVMRADKTYHARITLGATTTTYDAAGDVVSECDASQVTRADIEAALPQFLGEIAQVPPMYSAIKRGGKKLYELARQGQTVERPARNVTIHSLDLLAWRNPTLELVARCGAGTYIRSLAHDLGAALGVGAYLSGLTRRASGSFDISQSVMLDDLLEAEDWAQRVISPYQALAGYERVKLGEQEISRLQQGQFIPARRATASEPIFAFDSEGQLAAVLTRRAELWKPHKVFPRQS